MGKICDQLVPAAILLDNPGITLYEFDELLNRVKRGYIQNEIGTNSFLGNMLLFPEYHRGILGTAANLHIIRKESKNKFSQRTIGIPYFEIVPRKRNGKWVAPKYRITEHLGEVEGEIFEEDVHVSRSLVVGEITFPRSRFRPRIIVEGDMQGEVSGGQFWEENDYPRRARIIEVHPLTEPKEGETFSRFDDGTKIYKQKLKLIEIIHKFLVREFQTLDALVKEHEWATHERVIDFERKNGEVYCSYEDGSFYWKQENGRYFLDLDRLFREKETQNKNPERIYTSIILTAEAIKKKAWRNLEYISGDEFDARAIKFLLKNPDSHQRHNNAVFDWWTAKYGQMKGMNNFDWIRWRAIQPRPDLETERKILRALLPDARKRANWRRKRNRASVEAIQTQQQRLEQGLPPDDDPPF